MVIEPEENKECKCRKDVPYIVHEGEVSRLERIIKRMWLAVLALIIALLVTNFAWIWYINQYDFESYEFSTEGGGYNNYIGSDGDIYNGENANQETS